MGAGVSFLFIGALVAQVDALLHRDPSERRVPINVRLLFGTSLYLREGVCLRSTGRPYNYDEFTAGRSGAIEPSTTLYLLGLETLERLGFRFQIDRWTSGALAGWSVTLPFWLVIAGHRGRSLHSTGRPDFPRTAPTLPRALRTLRL